MADDWAARFDKFHAPAGSATGGQFASASGSGSKGAKGKTPAKSSAHPAASGHGGSLGKQALLQEAHRDTQQAKALEIELDTLQKQEHAAVANAKHQATAAAAAKKSGHVVKHQAHAATAKHHHAHARTLKERITALKTKIRGLRAHAASLEKQAHAMRAAGLDTDLWQRAWQPAHAMRTVMGDFDEALHPRAPDGRWVVDPGIGRVTANQGKSQDMIRLGIFHANTQNKTQYINPTAFGFALGDQPDPSSAHFRIEPNGRVFRVPSSLSRNRDKEQEKHVGTYRVVKKHPSNGRTGLERVTDTVQAARAAGAGGRYHQHALYVIRSQEQRKVIGLDW